AGEASVRVREARVDSGVPGLHGAEVQDRRRTRRRDRGRSDRQAALYHLQGGSAAVITPRPVGAGSTTIPRAALRAPDLFLTATVAAFILATFLVSAVPGLSRLPHLIIGLMIVGFIIRSIRIPLTFAFDGVAPLAVAFVAYAFASVLWSTDQSSALVSAI